jgi:two-component system, cell cycle response regulator
MKILVAEDDPVYCRILETTLAGWGYEVTLVGDGGAALEALKSDDAPKLAILVWMMPKVDGVVVCLELRRCCRPSYTYLLLLTARTFKGDLVAGLQAGADDYLIKPFDPPELQARLYAGRRILELQDQLVAASEAMRHQATRDHLTGAWNHRAIMEILERELQRAGRESRPVAVVLADLDHFKKVNDTYGHLGGDAVLREAGRRMLTTMRPYDMVGRYGGEEFLVVLPGCDQSNAARFAERLRERIAGEPVRHESESITVTASQGVAAYAGTGYADVYALLHAADAALYRAKNSGRNRVEVAAGL